MAAKSARILIADDDSVSLQLLAGLFSRGCELCTVRSGEEALNSIPDFKPDIVLLDIVMKGINGFDVCVRLKANPETASIPVLFIVAKDDVDAELRSLHAGGADFITRPFVPAVVKARVTNYIDLKRTKDGLTQLTVTDELTGLYNRRYFNRMLDAEVNRAARSGGSLSLMLMDIDRFKHYRNRNGALAGDECLRLIARTVKQSFRRVSDVVARYGAEEIAALVPYMDLQSACQLAETVRRNVEDMQIAYSDKGEEGVVTLSVGVSCVAPGPGFDPKTLPDLADKALFQAKSAGRNRVVSAE